MTVTEKTGMREEGWVCRACGYRYQPGAGDPDRWVPPNTPFTALPARWTCPVCGVTKAQFDKEGGE